MTKKPLMHPYLLLFVGICAVSTAAIFIRFALDEAQALVVAAYRMSISSLISFALLFLTKTQFPRDLQKKQWGLLFLSGAFLAVHFAVWISSLAYISVSSSVILVTTTPLWVALLSPLVLKEKVCTQFFYGMAIAFVGGIVIALSGNCLLSGNGLSCAGADDPLNGSKALGYLLALLGAFMAAGYMLIGRKLRKDMPTLSYTAIVYGIAALILVIAVVIRGDQLLGYSARTMWLFLAMAVIPQILGHTVLNHSLQALPATIVSMALLGEPIGSTILAIVFLNEIPSALEGIGGIIILVGIVVSIFPGKRTNAV